MPPQLSLVTDERLERFLDLEEGADNTLVLEIAAAAEALFVAACGREGAPFRAAQPGREEVRDGTGTRVLWLDYPADAIASVELLRGDGTVEELDPDDASVLRWRVGGQRLTRVDGGHFGCFGEPDAVLVTYNAQADQPEDAAVAVSRLVATVYRQLGSEDVKSERTGGYSAELASAIADDPMWDAAVAAHRRVEV